MTTTLYKNHGKTIGYWSVSVELVLENDTAFVVIQHSRALGGKVTESRYEAKPKNVGRANETTSLDQAHSEALSRINKQLDKGYVRTLEEAQAGGASNTLGLKMPMTAHPIEKIKPEKIDWGNAFCQYKADGHRCLYKDGVLYSRQGKELHVPHIKEEIEALGLGDMHLDGELYAHGRSLQDIGSLIKRYREESLELKYWVYDVVENYGFADRINKLNNRLRSVATVGIVLMPTKRIEDREQLLEFHAKAVEEGWEGAMLRQGSSAYEDGKRSWSLLKAKSFTDEEFMIVGADAGTPRQVAVTTARAVGYPVCDDATGNLLLPQGVWTLETAEGKRFTATMQGDMGSKYRLLRDAEEHIGKMLTVKFHYYSAEKVPQLPVAIRFREDI